jgi:monofunctional biosynthetic peptidoglycan transglycosylase
VAENPDTTSRPRIGRFSLLCSLASLILLAVRWIDPPTTEVHMEHRLQAWIHHRPYHDRYEFVSLSPISPDFQHAVIAAEGARFYQHHGFEWHAIEIAAEDDMEDGRICRGSNLTQQLVKYKIHYSGLILERMRQ